MTYQDRLEQIKTLRGLYDFRDELRSDVEKYSELWARGGYAPLIPNLELCQQANFFIDRVNAQIECLERQGVFLAQVDS